MNKTMTGTVLLAVACLLWASLEMAGAETFWLAKDGRSQARIFAPATQGEPLRLAVEELRNALEKMTGARLEPAWGAPRKTDSGIRLEVLDPSERDAGESAQTFTIEETGRFVRIVGHTETAVLYGVYQYLHELGVRWFMPGEIGEHIPEVDALPIGERSRTYTPDFVQRLMCHSGGFRSHFDSSLPPAEQERIREEYSLWHVRNRTHFLYVIPRRDWFVFNWPLNMGSGHGLRRAALGGASFQEEPERFPMLQREGKPVRTDSGPRQICFTHPSNIQSATDWVLDLLEEKEAIAKARNTDLLEVWDAVSMGLADTYGICECEDCRTVGGQPPFNKDRLVWSFYNQVIEKVNRRRPEAKIYIFAPYMELTRPPEGFRIHSNMVASAARTTTWSARPEHEPYYPFTKDFYENLLATRNAGAELRAREYVLWRGTPQTLNILDAVKAYHELGYRHYNLEVMNRGETLWPVLWTLARYTFDSSTSPHEILAEYCRGCFGQEAGDSVLALLKELDANSRKIQRIGYGSLSDTSAMLPDDTIAHGREVLAAALENTQGKAQKRLENFRRTFEMTCRMAESYRAYCRALNRRTPADREAALSRVGDFIGYWDEMNLAATCSPNILISMREIQKALETLEQAEPRARAGLEDPRAWMLDLFAAGGNSRTFRAADVPGTLPDLFPLPEIWRFRIDYLDIGRTEKWHRPDYQVGDGWQPLSTWNTFAPQGYRQVHGRFWYRLEFDAPRFPEGKTIIMRMGSLDDEGEIYLNGNLVFEQDNPENWNRSLAFDITPYINQGQRNVLVVRGYDAFGAGGLWRPCAIYTE